MAMALCLLSSCRQNTSDEEHSETKAWLTEATADAGLSFTHTEGQEQWDIRPTMGPGAAWADVDGDESPDLYVVGGTEQSGRLFLNDGTGHFTDVTAAWGLETPNGSGMGACFADWDADGDQDLYVTYDGPNVMWRNDGNRFTNITAEAGTGDTRWGAGAAFADVDGDEDLDLYVTNYLEFDLALIPPESEEPGHRREDPLAMLPYVFPGQPNVLYRNEGGGRFTDITELSGLLAPDGKSLGAIFFDADEDGDADLYVANDTTPNTYWENDGQGHFEELSLFVGLDDPRGGMGLAGGDVDGDGDVDLALTNWQLEPNALYRNNHRHQPSTRKFMPRFEDVAVRAGLARHSVGYVGWGCVLADLDNDGDLDAFVANGYTSPDYETTMICVGQPNQLFENVTEPHALTHHRDVPRWELVDIDRAGAWAAQELPSRGLAAADADGDGDLDLVVTANNGPLVYLRNDSGGRSLRVVPEGSAANRDAVGARIELLLEGEAAPQVAIVRAGSGYLGNHQRGVHFGLGEAQPRAVSVLWPDGTKSTHEVPQDVHLLRPRHSSK
ncbi:MAG: CRTAC1 family protein [Planctomycetota bacterium]|nr:CRTAC1 family protein [Planctomycetota bacterium]